MEEGSKLPKMTEDNVSVPGELLSAATSGAEITTIVSRKANIGNFETIDVGVAVKLPVNWEGDFSAENLEDIKLACSQTAEAGFSIASAETFERFIAIKEQIGS